MTTVDLNKIRIDHIGSLVRPAKLKEVFARFDRGQADKEELAQAQDQAIRDVIAQQENHGYPVVTDGEFRRHSFQESFSECVTGFDVPKNINLYYEKRDLNENPLERAEQNFEEAGPAIITRRGAVERLKARAQPANGGVSLRPERRQSPGQSDDPRPRPHRPTFQMGSDR